MIFWNSVRGFAQVEVTGADLVETIGRINREEIPLYEVVWLDDLTVRFHFLASDRKKVEEICRKRGDGVKILKEKSFRMQLLNMVRRPVLLTGICFFLLLTLILPTRILFFRVEGNETIPARRILEAAEQCGVRFGASRRALRSERMKNALLEAVPGLKWAGINTSGCTAVISVREQELQTENRKTGAYGNMVAVRDGYITSCTVTRGNSLCSPGQIVREGQVLISGFTDCGICIQVTGAEGEVYAQTSREFTALAPSETQIRRERGETVRRFSLVLGKKRINLWKDSGISDTTCGRMYEEYNITLPGGFHLPVRLCVETRTAWTVEEEGASVDAYREKLKFFARQSVLEQMTAGRILQEEQVCETLSHSFGIRSRFLCEEMIGRIITEEIGDFNGKTD